MSKLLAFISALFFYLSNTHAQVSAFAVAPDELIQKIADRKIKLIEWIVSNSEYCVESELQDETSKCSAFFDLFAKFFEPIDEYCHTTQDSGCILILKDGAHVAAE